MKKGWEVKKMGELCEIKTGRRDANHGNPNGVYHFFTCAKDHSYIDDYSFDTEAILVAGNGDVANKIGTYMVAVLAKRHNIPFYVACPLSTIDRSISSGEDIPIEERPISEVTGYQDNQWAAEGISVRNPAFDVTPADLVTGIITEKGVIFSPSKEKIDSLFISD